MPRSKKIPSIDYSIRLIVERLRKEFLGEIEGLRETVRALTVRVEELERELAKLQRQERWLAARSEFGLQETDARRVSQEQAQKFILHCLQRAKGRYVPSSELGGPLGIGRATVAARIRELRELGYEIVSSPRKGYALVER